MALKLNNRTISPDALGSILKAMRRISSFEIRQARFFSSRLPEENLREDFHTLLLLLLATLWRGYPRAREEEIVRCVEIESVPFTGAEHPEEITLEELSGLPEAVKEWYRGVTDEKLISGLAPLVKKDLNKESYSQPLVIYDSARRAFSFQAYFNAESLLSEVLPHMLKTGNTEIDIPEAQCAISNALKKAFAGRKAHIRQILAAAVSLKSRFSIISGGPGTGKSTVVHLVIRAICEYYHIPSDSVVLCAPTGRAKARLHEAVTRDLADDDPFSSVQARTLHSLLGISESGRPRYTNDNHLPYRLIVVDEVSMVDMRLFAWLVNSLSPESRLVLVGDMDQLPPVDAGAVLGDLTSGLAASAEKASLSNNFLTVAEKIISGLEQSDTKKNLLSTLTTSSSLMVDHVVFLSENYRSDKRILKWWEQILQRSKDDGSMSNIESSDSVEYRGIELNKSGDAEAELKKMTGEWMGRFLKDSYEVWKNEIRPELTDSEVSGPLLSVKLRSVIESRRILCCVHEGRFGRNRANSICDFLFRSHKGIPKNRMWHDGQPVIVNRNQGGGLELYNGDLGVILEDGDNVYGCFPVRGGVIKVPVERISGLDEAYAISVHKSQGSEFREIMLLVPDSSAMPVTRQLIYTAVTRAKDRVCILDPAGKLANADLLQNENRYSLLREIPG